MYMYFKGGKCMKIDLESIQNKRVFLLDFSYHLYRAHHAFFELCVRIDEDVVPTGHLVGVLNTIMNIKNRYHDSVIILCLDGYPKERRELCEKANIPYKANRTKSSYNIKVDTDLLCNLCSLVPNVYICEDEEMEADDLLFTMSRVMPQNNKFYIFTSDNDLLQSINDNTTIMKGFDDFVDYHEYCTRETLLKKFKATSPDHLPLFRALCGDVSDNIKGIPRIPKEVAKIIAESINSGDSYKDLSHLYDIVKPSQVKWLHKVEEDSERLNYNYQIMKLKISKNFVCEHVEVYKDDMIKYIDLLQLNQYKQYLRKHNLI